MTTYSNVRDMEAKPLHCVHYLARSIDRAFDHPVFILAIHFRAVVLAAFLYRDLPVVMSALPRFHPRVFLGCGVDGVGQVALA